MPGLRGGREAREQQLVILDGDVFTPDEMPGLRGGREAREQQLVGPVTGSSRMPTFRIRNPRRGE